jgi:hypothetical protein
MMSSRNVLRITAASLLFFISPLISPVHLHAGNRQRVVAVSPPSTDLSLTFTDGGVGSTAVIDAGTATWKGGETRMTVITRSFGVRIGRPSREVRGTATLRAFLETPDPRATIRIDGIVLGTAPVVIQHHAPIGVVVTHKLEIEVPVTAPDGPLAASIGWEAGTK